MTAVALVVGDANGGPPTERAEIPSLNADDFCINAPSTIRLIQDFLSVEEEQTLLDCVNAAPKPKWHFLRNRRLQNYGGLVGQNGLISDGEMPEWLSSTIDKIMSVRSTFNANQRPNHVLINEYLPGQGISMHEDGPAFIPLIATISLGSTTLLDFYEPLKNNDDQRSPDARRVGSLLLQPRSLVLISDEAYRLLHGIREQDADQIDASVFNRPPSIALGTTLKRHTRISLTIRHVEKVKKLKITSLLNKR